MPTSPSKKRSNRRNARKSTGPKSTSGKSAVAVNAITHGLRTLNPVIPGVEDPIDWETHRQTLVDRLEPEGSVEQAFAERIALHFWRLGRVAQMEARILKDVREQEYWSEIRQASWREDYRQGNEAGQVINECLEEECAKRNPIVKLWNQIEAGGTNQTIDPSQADQLLNHSVKAHEWKQLVDTFNEEFDWPPVKIGQLREMTKWLSRKISSDPPLWMKLQAERARKDSNEAVARRDRIQRAAEMASEIAAASSGVMDKILRYETSIHRALLRDTHELQRLQAMRLGAADAVPMAVDVTTDG